MPVGSDAPISATSTASAAARRRAPGVLLQRLSGPLNALLACGIARFAEANVVELLVESGEAESGGMVSISMRVLVRCPACTDDGLVACLCCRGAGTVADLFNAWLAIPPGVVDGSLLLPSALLPAMTQAVQFRICLAVT